MILILFFTTIIASNYAKSENSARLILTFNNQQGVINAMSKLSDKAIEHFPLENINGLVVNANERALALILDEKDILNIEEDQIVWASPKPDRPPKPDKGDNTVVQEIDWGVLAIKADNVWNRLSGSGVNVAVIDTGISLTHDDLYVVDGINFTRAKSYNDDNGHGTHVAGTIAGLDNDIGVKGVAYDANLYAVKVLDRKGSGYLSDVIAGIDWSIENGMDVINMSLGSNSESFALEQILIAAEEANIIAIAASGNDAAEIDFPGAYNETIAVGAIDSINDLAYFSSFGPELDVVAPGVNIYSTYKGEDYRALNGTSMATPHITGLAVLFTESNRKNGLEVNLNDFRNALSLGSTDLGSAGYDNYYGYGLPQAQSVIFGEILE